MNMLHKVAAIIVTSYDFDQSALVMSALVMQIRNHTLRDLFSDL